MGIILENQLFLSLSLLFFVFIYLVIEHYYYRKALTKIPLRIHINGSRGKSSIVEYLLFALRDTHYSAMGKITGIQPMYLYNDKESEAVKRWGPARVQEQFSTVKYAAKDGYDTLILECMSINPDLQSLEAHHFQPHISVISNIRNDHQEEMGVDHNNRLKSILSFLPENSKIILHKNNDFEHIKGIAESLNNRCILSESFVNQEELREFSGVFAENINLTLSICIQLGLNIEESKDKIIDAIRSRKDSLEPLFFPARNLEFINAFAVNDTDSLNIYLNKWNLSPEFKHYALLNTRDDRPYRTVNFCKWIVEKKLFKGIILMGTQIPFAKKLLIDLKIPKENIYIWNGRHIEDLLSITGKAGKSGTRIVSLANIAGDAIKVPEKLQAYIQDEV